MQLSNLQLSIQMFACYFVRYHLLVLRQVLRALASPELLDVPALAGAAFCSLLLLL